MIYSGRLNWAGISKYNVQNRKESLPLPSIWPCCHCNWVRWNVELETSDVLPVVVVVWTNSLTAMSVTRASLFLFLVPVRPEFEFFLWYFLWRRCCFFLTLIVVAGVDTQPPIIMIQLTNLTANCWCTMRRLCKFQVELKKLSIPGTRTRETWNLWLCNQTQQHTWGLFLKDARFTSKSK